MPDIETMVRWFDEWRTTTADQRARAERDARYYHGRQWSAEELAELGRREQPAIVKNRIAKKINFLIGQEVRNRTDPKALPRTPEHDQDVSALTDGLRYVVDEQDFDHVASRVWRDVLVRGYGGCVVDHSTTMRRETLARGSERIPGGARSVEIAEMVPEHNPRIRQVKWDRIWFDPYSREADFSDWMYGGITLWMYLDDAKSIYSRRPDAIDDIEGVLEHATSSIEETGDTHDDRPSGSWIQTVGGRKRIRISEVYFKQNGEHGAEQWHTAHHVKGEFLVPPKPTGYLDEHGNNVCPLILQGAFVDDETGERYGLVRNMIGPQDEINKRSSKMLHLISVDKMIYERGAVLNVDEAQTERAKPDGAVEVQTNALSQSRVIFEKGTELAQGHAQMLQEAKLEIDTVGPELPSIGSVAGGASGTAIAHRLDIGSLELASIEDGHRRFKRRVYRQAWFRIRQFWPDEKWVRVRDDANREGFRFVGLNVKKTKADRIRNLIERGVPPPEAMRGLVPPDTMARAVQMLAQHAQAAGAQVDPQRLEAIALDQILSMPMMQEPVRTNDVASLDVDILLDESPDVSILQQEEFQHLSQLIPSFLQAQMPPQPLLELAIEASQIRSKRKILEMLRQPPDPAQMEMQQQMQQIQAQMQQMQLALAQAGVQATQAKAALDQARAQKTAIESQAEGPRAQAEIEADEARAMRDAAAAGEIAGGGA